MRFDPIPGVKKVYGLIGHARHGKDEAAKTMIRLMPGAERYAMSNGVSALSRVLGVMQERDPEVLQRVGMWMRDRDESAWLRVMYGAIADARPEVAIITGIRFPNELDMVRSMGGTIVKIVRLNADSTHYVSTDRPRNSRAEQEIDALDYDACVVAVTKAELDQLVEDLIRNDVVAA